MNGVLQITTIVKSMDGERKIMREIDMCKLEDINATELEVLSLGTETQEFVFNECVKKKKKK